MKPVNLRAVDLNLLPILNVLLEEKSVTLASQRIHLSQSATSSALGRLREAFGDPILVRRGQHMAVSPKAQLIHKELSEALDGLTNVVTSLRLDQSVEETVTVTISGPEYVIPTLSSTIRDLLASGRRTNIHLEPFVRKTVIDHLERGLIDIALGAFGRLKPHFHRIELYKETPIVIMRESHPALGRARDGRICVDDLTGFPHVHVHAGEMQEAPWISKMLSYHHLERQVAAVLPTGSLAPDVLRHTDLLCVGTVRSFAELGELGASLATLGLPSEVDIHDYPIEMIWHDRTDDDMDFRAVRNRIVEGSAALRDGQD